MKVLASLALLIAVSASGQTVINSVDYSDCTRIYQEGNAQGYGTETETYRCGSTTVTLGGRWYISMEDHYLYTFNLGRLEGDPERVTPTVFKFWPNWCSYPKGQTRAKVPCELLPDRKAKP